MRADRGSGSDRTSCNFIPVQDLGPKTEPMILTVTRHTVIIDAMPSNRAYTLQDLADLADVSPRTVRYYVAQGLLPSPGQVGPGAHYTDGHLARLRLIRRLQREHLPLAEIRARLAELDDDAIADLLEAEAPSPPQGSALDYVRAILGGEATVEPVGPVTGPPRDPGQRAMGRTHHHHAAPSRAPCGRAALERGQGRAPGNAGQTSHDRTHLRPLPVGPRRLTPDIELHIRRPLSRQQNKRVDRLIAIARELLEENPS